jgi:hypothetical protein
MPLLKITQLKSWAGKGLCVDTLAAMFAPTKGELVSVVSARPRRHGELENLCRRLCLNPSREACIFRIMQHARRMFFSSNRNVSHTLKN